MPIAPSPAAVRNRRRPQIIEPLPNTTARQATPGTGPPPTIWLSDEELLELLELRAQELRT